MNPSPTIFSRQELFDLVWESPISSVAKRFGISDVALAKSCRKADIPLPPRGYWARLKAGKRVVTAQLPKRGLGMSDSLRIGDRYGYGGCRVELDAELPPPPSFPETVEEVVARAQSAVAKVKYPKTLSNPHHLIDEVLKEDAHRREQMLSDRFFWKKPIFDTAVDKRKIKILNAIFIVLSRVGERPYLRTTEPIESGATVGDTHVAFEIGAIEQKKRVTTNSEKSRTKARLRLEIDHHGVAQERQMIWQDEERVSLEDQIRNIAAGILIAGELKYRAQKQQTYDWMVERKEQHEEEKRAEIERKERERLEREIQLERKKRRLLIADVSGWRKAGDIREFVAAVRAKTDLITKPDLEEKLKQWSAWAMTEADKMDRMKRSPEELVDYLWEVMQGDSSPCASNALSTKRLYRNYLTPSDSRHTFNHKFFVHNISKIMIIRSTIEYMRIKHHILVAYKINHCIN